MIDNVGHSYYDGNISETVARQTLNDDRTEEIFMASWMVHFRIADRLMDYLKVYEEEFIVGNIGPDCGEPNEDWSAFYPSANVTHWKETEDKSGIKSEDFYNTYINSNIEISKKSFYLGYYVHLLTDVLWREKVYLPVKNNYMENFAKDKNFVWKVKEDWYDLDHKYLKTNKEFRTFRIFDKIKTFPNKYLEYYSNQAFEKQIKYISEFYNSEHENLEREYPYMTEDQMNLFVDEAVEEIKMKLIQKKMIVQEDKNN